MLTRRHFLRRLLGLPILPFSPIGWLSKDLYPTEGLLEDAILFGDVKGTLVKVSKGS
ncbi:MAG: hypothetical protein NT096_15700 [Proteobacteria bacterium]|nr:hypothetical protein [Pseudomonadota bacterium]